MIEASTSIWPPLAIAALFWLIVAVAGGLLTDTGPWYRALKLPSWKPPDWAFGPVWTIIFILATIAVARGWQAAGPDERNGLLVAVLLNGALNILWNVLFFWMRRPDLALWEVAALWLSILLLIVKLWPLDKIAGLMVLPYLLWVSVASLLTYSIVQLNR